MLFEIVILKIAIITHAIFSTHMMRIAEDRQHENSALTSGRRFF